MKLIHEFRPTIFFLARFIGLYVAGNLLYGIYVASYAPGPDPVTRWVTNQTVAVIDLAGWSSVAIDSPNKADILVIFGGRNILSVYEGCNGINVMVIFIGFILAIGPLKKTLWWFVPLGIAVIHASNILRIGVLFMVSLYFPKALFFAHKYLFTAFIYFVVFLLWLWWVRKLAVKKNDP